MGILGVVKDALADEVEESLWDPESIISNATIGKGEGKVRERGRRYHQLNWMRSERKMGKEKRRRLERSTFC